MGKRLLLAIRIVIDLLVAGVCAVLGLGEFVVPHIHPNFVNLSSVVVVLLVGAGFILDAIQTKKRLDKIQKDLP